MKKIIISVFLVCVMLLGTVIPAFASDGNARLQFDKDGEFKILHICDCQDTFPAQQKMLTYINYMLEIYEPDLVVLGGDNTVGPKETKDDAIKELVSPFVEHETYFTLVFGNHDHEQGVDKEALLKMYQKHGGKYCLAYDAVPELSGTATHNLPVYSSDGKKIKFNLWMFDSNTYLEDENGKRLGYDSVREDQIEWYNETYKALKTKAGEDVYSLAFQHMIPPDVYEAMFPSVKYPLSPITETYNNGTHYPIIFPDTSAFTGHIYEAPSPGVINYGQVDAMVENGDVLSVLVGHDHVNTYETEYKGIKLINTPGVSYNAYGKEVVRGSRLITINENSTDTFESEVITVNELAKENQEFREAMDISRFTAGFWVFMDKFALFFAKLSGVIAWVIY
ncbi:MAG: metallophosphoesterase [Acutalibacteraceae bacterium]|nr:metallophosphoesterase [Acutalibacteraceae bacterium]